MAGTAVYEYPVAGGVAPTALQTKETVVATLLSDGLIGDGIITHNMGLSAADLAAGRPVINLERYAAGALAAQWIVTAFDANTVTCTQLAAGGATNTIRVTIRRPHTIGR